jgi:hypothetical protein
VCIPPKPTKKERPIHYTRINVDEENEEYNLRSININDILGGR